MRRRDGRSYHGLLEFYPRGRFVHLIRNGRDVCLSLLDRRDANPLHSCMRWIVSLEAAAELSEHDRFYELRYENLVREPEETLGALFEWLNSEFDPRVLGFHENADGGVLGYGTTPVHTDSIGRWERQRETLPPTIRELVELRTRRHLRALGYEPIEDR